MAYNIMVPFTTDHYPGEVRWLYPLVGLTSPILVCHSLIDRGDKLEYDKEGWYALGLFGPQRDTFCYPIMGKI